MKEMRARIEEMNENFRITMKEKEEYSKKMKLE